MPIQRSPIQGPLYLTDYYQHIAASTNPVDRLAGEQMLQLLTLLDNLFPQLPLWGVTSMARLGLSRDPRYGSEWWVLIRANAIPGSYEIEYLLPADRRPWVGAVVQGTSYSWEQTTEYLLLAMRESGAWAANPAFNAVLAHHQLEQAKEDDAEKK